MSEIGITINGLPPEAYKQIVDKFDGTSHKNEDGTYNVSITLVKDLNEEVTDKMYELNNVYAWFK